MHFEKLNFGGPFNVKMVKPAQYSPRSLAFSKLCQPKKQCRTTEDMFSKHIEAIMVYSGFHSPSADDPQAGGDLGQLSRRLAKPPTVEVAAQGKTLSFEEVTLISRLWRLWSHGFCKGGAPQSWCLNIKRRATCHFGQLGHERCSHISE